MFKSMQQQPDFIGRKANQFKEREMGSQIRTGLIDFPKDRSQSTCGYFYNKKIRDPNILKMEFPNKSQVQLSHGHKIPGAYDSEAKKNYSKYPVDVIKSCCGVSQKNKNLPTIDLQWNKNQKPAIYAESHASMNFNKSSLVSDKKPIQFNCKTREYDILTNFDKKLLGDKYHNRFDFYDPTVQYLSRSHNRSDLPRARSREFNIITGREAAYGHR